MIADIKPIAEISQRTGMPIECCAFIGSSPIRQYAEGWTLDHLRTLTEEAVAFAVREGLPVMYVTEDTTRADPETLRALYTTAIRAGAHARLHRRHRRPRDARRRAALVRFVAGVVDECGGDVGIDWHGHRDRGFGIANSWPRSRRARRGCTAPRSASASASATRRWICCWSTWC